MNRRNMRQRALFLAAAAAGVLACGGGERDEPALGADTAAASSPDTGAVPPDTATRSATGWQTCANTAGGFTVDYPATWYTNDGRVMPPCSLFHPQPPEVPEASELPADIAVNIKVDDVAFDVVTASTFGVRVISTEALHVAGRPAVRRLVEHTGDGLWDAGMRSWEYVVNWSDGRTLMATTHAAGDLEFDQKRRVLDEMMTRLRVTTAALSPSRPT